MTSRAPAPAFPRARWAALLWMAGWLPAYALTWGWRNFLSLCDVSLAVSCVGVWRGSPLLLSSQALAAILPGALWTADVGARLTAGRHLFGGTEYMWDERVPLVVRLASLFHLGLPIALVAGLRRTGYDRRGLALEAGITGALLVASRALAEGKNMNYAFRDPIAGRELGPAPVHLGLTLLGYVLLVYLPTHLALARWLPGVRGRRPRA